MADNSWFIGEQIAVRYGYDNLGLWQNTPEDLAEMAKWNANGYKFTPGNVRPKDQNGDYKMDCCRPCSYWVTVIQTGQWDGIIILDIKDLN